MKFSLKRRGYFPAIIFSYFVLFPTFNKELELAIVFFISIFLLTDFKIEKLKSLSKDSKYILKLFLIVFIYYTIELGIGVYRGNPGAIPESYFYLVLFLIFVFFSFEFSNETFKHVLSAINFCLLLVPFLIVFYYIGLKGLFPDQIFFVLNVFSDQTSANTILMNAYGPEIRFLSIGSLIFLMPYGISRYSLSEFSIKDTLRIFLLILSVFISGRRILIWLEFLLFIIILIMFLVPKIRLIFGIKIQRLFELVCIFVLSSLLVNFSFRGFFMSAKSEIGNEIGNIDTISRVSQVRFLFKDFMMSPFFGQGMGFSDSNFVGDSVKPWRYEMQYSLYLACFGVAGVLLLLLLAYSLLKMFFRNFRSSRIREFDSFPILVGSVFAIIANATNPYLHTLSRYWMVFIFVWMTLLIDKTPASSPPS